MSARSHSHYVTSSKATAIAAGRVSEAGPVGEYLVSVTMGARSTAHLLYLLRACLLRACLLWAPAPPSVRRWVAPCRSPDP